MTSKFIIVNTDIPAFLPLRKKQVLINTWHGGGAYKKFALDNPKENTFLNKMFIKAKEKQTKYFISSCGFFSMALQTALKIPKEKILECGLPRNDLLIKNKFNTISIRNSLKINIDSLVVLYAPTYRNSYDDQSSFEYLFDFELIKKEFEIKYNKKVIFLFRAHYYFTGKSYRNDVLDVTNYPDMQELLAISDVLITDYSSSFWDFCLTKKPAFLFCSDLNEYDTERGFYVPIKKWPLPLATSNNELVNSIKGFNQNEYEKKLQEHYVYMQSYETGNARAVLKNIIEKEMHEN